MHRTTLKILYIGRRQKMIERLNKRLCEDKTVDFKISTKAPIKGETLKSIELNNPDLIILGQDINYGKVIDQDNIGKYRFKKLFTVIKERYGGIPILAFQTDSVKIPRYVEGGVEYLIGPRYFFHEKSIDYIIGVSDIRTSEIKHYVQIIKSVFKNVNLDSESIFRTATA